jgi:endonuclease III-like uncharacterized protein
MNIFLSLLLLLSLAGNVVLVWYTRKLVQNLYYGIRNVDEMQKLFEEYITLIQPLASMENYFNDPAITSAITNTKVIIEACKMYKNTMIEEIDEKNKKTSTNS